MLIKGVTFFMQQDYLSSALKLSRDSITGEEVIALNNADHSTYLGRDSRLAPRPQAVKVQQKRPTILNKIVTVFQERQNQQPFIPPPNPPQNQRPPLPPPPLPMPNPAVRLSRDIYFDLDLLAKAYRDLRTISNADEQTLQNLESQAIIMRSTMGNIYSNLSGNPVPPLRSDRLTLDENYCAALKQVADFTLDLNNNLLSLMRQVSVPSIDRQLLIINATLSSHERTTRNLYNECRLREV